MSVDAGEHDRIVRRDSGERVVRREARVAPLVLIPPAADHPAAGRQVLRASADSGDDRVVRASVGEVDVAQERAEPEQVRVRVDHAGDHDPAGEIEHLRRRSAQQQRFARRADEGHATAANGHRLDERMRIVDGVDLRVDENQVRRRRRLALGRRVRGADRDQRAATAARVARGHVFGEGVAGRSVRGSSENGRRSARAGFVAGSRVQMTTVPHTEVLPRKN